MSGFDEGGDSPCWAHHFEDELFGDRVDTSDDGDKGGDETEDVG